MADNWIRTRKYLSSAKVSQRLASFCRGGAQHAAGVLQDFWSSVSDNAHNGFIRDVDDRTLEDWAKWTGKRGVFAKWVRAHHMDADGRVNEWDEYMGELEHRREKERLKKQRQRAERRAKELETAGKSAPNVPGDNKGTVPGTSPATERNGTERNEKPDSGGSAPVARADSVTDPADKIAMGAIDLTVTANQAITAKFREQTNPMIASDGRSHALARSVLEAGIPFPFAMRSVALQCQSLAAPVRSMAYFEKGIKRHWEEHNARQDAAGSAPVPPLDSAPRANKPRSAVEIVLAQQAANKAPLTPSN